MAKAMSRIGRGGVPASDESRFQLSPGKILKRNLEHDPAQEYFLYLPQARVMAEAPVFVSVHGITRNAYEHARLFSPFAERYGVVLIAPLFPSDRFRGYQRLPRNTKRPSADLVLNQIVSEVGRFTEARIDKLFMFGYSGGGQFVHRYALFYPQNVARLVVASAGWYTFPDSTLSYPFGLKRTPGIEATSEKMIQFLSIPICVLVGEKDVLRDPELNKSRRIDRQQGINRLERGRRWIRSMAAAARAYHLDVEYRFEVISGCDHSFTKCMIQGGMGKRVFEFLFGYSVDQMETDRPEIDSQR